MNVFSRIKIISKKTDLTNHSPSNATQKKAPQYPLPPASLILGSVGAADWEPAGIVTSDSCFSGVTVAEETDGFEIGVTGAEETGATVAEGPESLEIIAGKFERGVEI